MRRRPWSGVSLVRQTLVIASRQSSSQSAGPGHDTPGFADPQAEGRAGNELAIRLAGGWLVRPPLPGLVPRRGRQGRRWIRAG
jgi:hypothetical protein